MAGMKTVPIEPAPSGDKSQLALAQFVSQETVAGLLLFCAAVFALVATNSALAPHYANFWQSLVEFRAGPLEVSKPLQLWVNDGLMALFFFLIGMEVKREVLEGQMSTLEKSALPLFAAVGGILVPALVFIGINISSPANSAGWAIPAATDIAFALGVLALLGKRVPPALKVLLLAVAIIDDVAAISIIAIFYTADVSMLALGLAGVAAAALIALNRMGVTRTSLYALVGVALWLCVLKSGIHATLAGVVTALAIPLRSDATDRSPLRELEHALHPWTAFLILPLFALANAGVSLRGFELDRLLSPLPLGVMLGLFVGKQVGVFGFMAMAARLGWASRPLGISWMQLYGLACLSGIGFTMSLFIGSLAFDDPAQVEAVKLGVLAGSIASGLIGYAVLRMAKPIGS
ncbi:MAG: Na+/H+ antiporter NhaA [Dokdonella sp.]